VILVWRLNFTEDQVFCSPFLLHTSDVKSKID